MRRPTWLRPRTALRRTRLLARVLLRLARLERVLRRRPLPALCADAGVVFGGFGAPEQPERPLPRDVAEVTWAVDVGLLLWPWGRDRRCLRRGLVLGGLIASLRPVLCLEVVRPEPLEMHAFLVAHGQRLDLGALAAAEAVGIG